MSSWRKVKDGRSDQQKEESGPRTISVLATIRMVCSVRVFGEIRC